MKLIVLGIPHTATNDNYMSCAFTQKVRKFVKMMSGRGHEIYHIGHADSVLHSSPDIHHITVTDDSVLAQSYGDEYVSQQVWKVRGLAAFFSSNDHAHRVFCQRSITAIKDLVDPLTIIVGFWGYGHKPIADAFPDIPFVEGGIGYSGAFSNWRIYESHAIRNAYMGIDALTNCTQSWYHRVIPNYFDLNDFDYSENKKDYILYLGRINSGKGVDIAIQATEQAGVPLIVAGPGTMQDLGYGTIPDHVTHFGYADYHQRRKLLSEARALIIGSKYLEPFAGVQVEAWLSGTPVISPDWAAFAEYNVQGETGFRCWVFRDFVSACTLAHTLNPRRCRKHGEQFSLEQIAPKFERYFLDVLDIKHNQGWYT